MPRLDKIERAMAEIIAQMRYSASAYGDSEPTVDSLLAQQEREPWTIETPGAMGSVVHTETLFTREQLATLYDEASAILASVDRGERPIY